MYAVNNKKKRVCIDLDEHLAREFKKRTVDYDCGMTDVIRPAIEEYMRTHPPIVDRRPNID